MKVKRWTSKGVPFNLVESCYPYEDGIYVLSSKDESTYTVPLCEEQYADYMGNEAQDELDRGK